ncbi:hypothetical protein E2C01_095556 [Portunus trituberculatus]|uniref:Uncharacterized protein n=1 Tax=Portunus trituberculatus TaxID=210409 RepID=A0A5B7JZQ0_PORTR|nr:hypothetical protein [Portunus trituberculatus]
MELQQRRHLPWYVDQPVPRLPPCVGLDELHRRPRRRLWLPARPRR